MKHQWKAYPKNDRLKRWEILGFSEGRGKPVIAENIRSEDVAHLIAAAPDMHEALQLLIPIAEMMKGKTQGVVAALLKADDALAKARGETL